MTTGEARIDLHAHSTASDGLLSPQELVGLAIDRGVQTFALTDHDTAAGVRLLGGDTGGVEVVPGIEVSSHVAGGELHVLGLFIDPHHPRLFAYEEERGRLRGERMVRMVAGLQAAGHAVSMEEVEVEIGGDGAPGRPHLARVLVRKGIAKDMGDCFQRLLLPGGPGYAPYPKPNAREAASLIRDLGGVAVIAHPGLDRLDPHLEELVASGMQGIEVWHSGHSREEQGRYEAFGRKHRLLLTGGSDFHGVGVKEGGLLGSVGCPVACLTALREAAGAPT